MYFFPGLGLFIGNFKRSCDSKFALLDEDNNSIKQPFENLSILNVKKMDKPYESDQIISRSRLS